MNNNLYERIYTIGCFDWFHYGHEKLLKRMKEMGKNIIVGVHDDASIEQLKNLKPDEHQPLKTRMENVKKFADVVYVVPDKDPTFFLKSVIGDYDSKENACFVRGIDMPNFPGREIVEGKMAIKLVPYTEGVSSTQIRNEHKKN